MNKVFLSPAFFLINVNLFNISILSIIDLLLWKEILRELSAQYFAGYSYFLGIESFRQDTRLERGQEKRQDRGQNKGEER